MKISVSLEQEQWAWVIELLDDRCVALFDDMGEEEERQKKRDVPDTTQLQTMVRDHDKVETLKNIIRNKVRDTVRARRKKEVLPPADDLRRVKKEDRVRLLSGMIGRVTSVEPTFVRCKAGHGLHRLPLKRLSWNPAQECWMLAPRGDD